MSVFHYSYANILQRCDMITELIEHRLWSVVTFHCCFPPKMVFVILMNDFVSYDTRISCCFSSVAMGIERAVTAARTPAWTQTVRLCALHSEVAIRELPDAHFQIRVDRCSLQQKQVPQCFSVFENSLSITLLSHPFFNNSITLPPGTMWSFFVTLKLFFFQTFFSVSVH